MLKIKRFSDAEYQIVNVEIAPMRLFINGVPGEYPAIKNIIINYKG